jgi:hypothetical protein
MRTWPSYAALLFGAVLLIAAGLFRVANQYIGGQSQNPDDLNHDISAYMGVAAIGLLVNGLILLIGGVIRFRQAKWGGLIILAGIILFLVASTAELVKVWTASGGSALAYALLFAWLLSTAAMAAFARALRPVNVANIPKNPGGSRTDNNNRNRPERN